jgi:hypothetical protein
MGKLGKRIGDIIIFEIIIFGGLSLSLIYTIYYISVEISKV